MNQKLNQAIPKPKLNFSLWNQLESKKISREELQPTLFKKLGEPSNELQTNLAQEIIKKIISYYFTSEQELNYTIYSVVGQVVEIVNPKYKTGPRRGQTYYVLILANKEKLQAKQELLKPEQWEQITKLALLGQNLVFQYRKWITNKQVLGWYPVPKKSQK